MKSKRTLRSSPLTNDLATRLAGFAREFHSRGWALGTSGNYSAILHRDPLKLLITSSGRDKSALTRRDFLEIDGEARVLAGKGAPSAETALHLAVARARPVGCILHVHSVWNTLLSERHAAHGALHISGYEMLKGLEGNSTHDHTERIPIFANSQDLPQLAGKVADLLQHDRAVHGFLLAGHGLYTWGVEIEQARRHVEIFEFLFEVVGRQEFSVRSQT